MKILDPIQSLRAEPDRFLPRGRFNPALLAERLATDATLLGANRCEFRRIGDWWIVSADHDWLELSQFSPSDLFGNVVAFPESGVNAMRSEVLLGAFADEVLIATPTKVQNVVGDSVESGKLLKQVDRAPWARMVLFRAGAGGSTLGEAQQQIPVGVIG